ncbi:MAG TPA: single-stranded-DNA-specific exonuclease RecJ [Ktedonobacterales bacterium]
MTDSGSSTEGTATRQTAMAAMAASLLEDSAGQRVWQIAEQLPPDVLKGLPSYTPLQVQLLHNRRVRGDDAVRAFLQADWRASDPPLRDLDRAATRILQATQRDERIIVFGDYDCDGLTSCALLSIALQALGARVTPFVPIREDDGRGLNRDALDKLAKDGANLIITTDCGSANVEETERARSLGIDVIVTDHHPPHGLLPQAHALVNPRHPDDLSHNKDLAGVGVAFRLAERLLQEALPGDKATAALTRLLDLVAVGTIGDVVPLSPENWALAHAGLRQLNTAPRAGLLALIRSANQRPGEITARDISFSIAPRLNAAGRLGEPMWAVKLLMTDDPIEAETIAAKLETLNLKRQATTETVLIEARRQIGAQRHSVLITQGDDWPYGILGLVAGRLSEDHHLPAFVISCANGECRGSARAPQGMDLGSVLAARPEFFRRFGGHAQAVGFTLDADQLGGFLAYLNAHFAATNLSNQHPLPSAHDIAPLAGTTGQAEQQSMPDQSDAPGEGIPRTPDRPLMIDCRLPLRSILPDRAEAIARLAPYGQGFEEPVFICEGVRIVRCWPSGVEGRNLRLVLRESTSHGSVERVALWPRQGSRCEELRRQLPQLPPLDVAYTLQSYRNRYNDTIEVVARIVALRATQQPT